MDLTEGNALMPLSTTATFENIAHAFARDAQILIRYRRFAATAKHEGYSAAAALFERLAESQLTLVEGHFDFLREATDPLTGAPFGHTSQNLKAALICERDEAERLYSSAVRVADSEEYPSIAAWFRSIVAHKVNNVERIEEAITGHKSCGDGA